MQVILTHEQADFDAIASLLGASLLQKDACVVLPSVMNRNVQSFIHLYGADLPFIKSEDLPNEPITAVTLVDTQSLVTLRGMRKDAQVCVIDHHQKRADLPESWQFEAVDTIACTTRFVESLQEINGHLSLIHATLLLLGIYEDSGSLTYAHTTSRDAAAVAYLLENGASLKIAADFLNQPLSPAQHKVFDDLLARAESLNLQNCKVMLSSADAADLEDEVSSIAHKICDLLDPDALFIFVRTREGIRLVARSVTDQINVAAIARKYNGGGHSRASSALIKVDKKNPVQMDELITNFKQDLPAFVQPAVTVNQLMSKKPLTISPATTARQAYQLMQRFGYEGYPVVENNEVKGLLTRRAVDRAISHNLDAQRRQPDGGWQRQRRSR
jgi:Exopolyphosphatase-related proteins